MSHDHHSSDHSSGPELDRREFLRLAGASVALAGLGGCARMPAEHILPYADNRPELTPGVGQYYATAMCVDGCATGLIVESHDGRPTKVEGNPQHPASLGASGPIHQASVLQLYDPDRAKSARVGTARVPWSSIAAAIAPAALRMRVGTNGSKLRLLIEPSSSPLDEELLGRLLAVYPGAHVHMYAPFGVDSATRVVPHYDFSSADVILAIDSDFLASGPFHLRYARQFADRRRLASPSDAMNRLYVIESSFTPTGAAADHRFALRPADTTSVVHALASLVRGGAVSAPMPAWVAAVARDLTAHRGRAAVVGGASLPRDVRDAVDGINAAIGASGQTTWYAPSPLIGGQIAIRPFDELVAALKAREVDTLVVIGGNPSYATPQSLDFSSLLRTVPNAGYLGAYENETARDVRWFVPMSHYLESWGDARAYDGTLSIVQPLVRPLYESQSPAELYAALGGASVSPGAGYQLLRESVAKRFAGDADAAWSEALQRGVVSDTSTTARSASSAPAASQIRTGDAAIAAAGTVDVIYALDPKVHDGGYANNGWLQELPAPITQLTWGNAALVSPATARRLGVGNGDALTLSDGPRHLAIAAFVVPGHADDAVTVHLGYGRSGAESAARGVGANAYLLWPAVGARVQQGVHVAAGGSAPPFALAQSEAAMVVESPVRRATLADYR
ncbi:MAG: hypothetical protein ACHQWU_11110, partial [Gemmatimonadales bacterium]